MASTTFTSAEDLIAHVAQHYTSQAVIGIDGWMRAGKTSLAKALAKSTAGVCWDLDCFLNDPEGSYLDAFDHQRFQASVLAPRTGMLFLSGVCLRQICEESGFRISAHIYVKRMRTYGWADEDEALRTSAGLGRPTRLTTEARNYHRAWQPHHNADIEYHRFEL